jgi:hypothetical protein
MMENTENTMSKKASALLLELLASRIDAAGVHCLNAPTPTPTPGGDDPDDGDNPDEPPDDPYKPDPAIGSSRCYA